MSPKSSDACASKPTHAGPSTAIKKGKKTLSQLREQFRKCPLQIPSKQDRDLVQMTELFGATGV